MSLASEYVELRDQLHVMRKELAAQLGTSVHYGIKPGEIEHSAATASHPQLARIDRALSRLEAGLYPICQTCGDRIEMDRLKSDPAETECWSCGSRHAKAVQAQAGCCARPDK